MVKILKLLAMPIGVITLTLAVGMFLSRLPGRGKTKKHIVGRLLLLVGLLALYVLSIQPVANALVHPLESRYRAAGAEALKDVDAIVVLGGGAYQASKMRPRAVLAGASLARLVGGIKLFRSSGARYLVLSGYSSVEGGLTVAEVMARSAVDLGVPGEKIILEKKATTTFEHPPRIIEIFPQIKQMKIAVVTSASHMPRSIAAFEQYFDAEQIVPAPVNWYHNTPPLCVGTFLPSAGALTISTLACHEYLGRLWYRIRPKPRVTHPATQPTR